jgi:hypothetical protein
MALPTRHCTTGIRRILRETELRRFKSAQKNTLGFLFNNRAGGKADIVRSCRHVPLTTRSGQERYTLVSAQNKRLRQSQSDAASMGQKGSPPKEIDGHAKRLAN